MSKNPHGGTTGNMEWGRKHRKEEDRLRGLPNRARREAIAERTRELLDES
jgi:hypothetical protein